MLYVQREWGFELYRGRGRKGGQYGAAVGLSASSALGRPLTKEQARMLRRRGVFVG